MSAFAPAKVKVNQSYTYGFVYGGSTGVSTGTVSDWYLIRAATPNLPATDQPDSAANILEYFDADDAAMDDTSIWLLMPLLASGYGRANIMLRNVLGVDITVEAYLVPGNIDVVGTANPVNGHFNKLIDSVNAPHTVATGSNYNIAIGAIGDDAGAAEISTDWIGGWLMLSVTPASDPPSGHWQIGVMRSL